MQLQETVTGQPKDVDLGYSATVSPYFNGSSDQIDIPYAPDLNPTSFTIEMWVQFQGGRGYRAILTSVSGSASLGRRGYVFCINPAQQWQFWLGSGHKGIPWIIITGWKVTQGVWTHLAGTYDSLSEIMILYVNGQAVGQWKGIEFQPNDRHPMHVGAGATEQTGASSCFFRGSIKNVRIWESSLSPAEIQMIAAKGQSDRKGAQQRSDRQTQGTSTPVTMISPPTGQTGGKQTQKETTSSQTGQTGGKQTRRKTTSSQTGQTGGKQTRRKTTSSQTGQTGGKQTRRKTTSSQTEQNRKTQTLTTTTSPPTESNTSTQSKESFVEPVLVFDGKDNYVEVPYANSVNPSQ